MTTENQNQLEQHIIGIALQGPRDLNDLATVKADWFTNPVHADTWRIIQHLHEQGRAVDPIAITANLHVADELTRRQINLAYLADCATGAPYGHVGHSYARLLKEASDRHTTAQALTRGQQLLSGNASTRDVRLTVLEQLQAITDEESQLTSITDAVTETLATYDQHTPFTATPWGKLNLAIRGWRPGGLYVVGARPGVGKSLMLQKAAIHQAEHGHVLFETMEMDHVEVTNRLLSTMSGVSLNKLVGLREDGTSPLSPQDREALRTAATRLRELPIHFGQRVQVPADIREHARTVAVRGPLAGIFVDYMQLLGTPRGVDRRVQELTAFTRQLKQMAMEFDCPVIVAAQMNRNSATAGRPPGLAEFRESGSMEQDADVAIILHESPDEVHGDEWSALDAHVAKNRQGPEKVALLRRHGPTATIDDDMYRTQPIGG